MEFNHKQIQNGNTFITNAGDFQRAIILADNIKS